MSTNSPVDAGSLAFEQSKVAETATDVHDLIRARWSPRAFSDREVSEEDLKTVFDAARWAASSYNEQPWRFIVARKQDAEAFERILNLLVPMNQQWAKTAPVLFITAAKKRISANGSLNRYALHDAGQALANLMLQATALGLHAHAMGGFNYDRARTELQIPDDFEVGAAVALGYRASPDTLSDRFHQMEIGKRARKPLETVVFGGVWNQPLPF